MKKTILYMAALAPLAFASCLSDEGNYDYTELQEVEITGLGDNIRCVLLEQQDITPTVTTTLPDSRLEYVWRVGADTLARQKTLDYTFKKVPGSNAPLTFEVIDKQTRVRYTKNIALTVVSPFTTGYAVLTDAGKLAFQSFESGEKLYQDAYQEANEEALTGTPRSVKSFGFNDASNNYVRATRLCVVMEGGKSPELDGMSLARTNFYEDEFHGDAPAIAYNSAQFYGSDYAFNVVGTDGKVYVKFCSSTGTPDDGYFEYPLETQEAGCKVAPCIARLGASSYDCYYTSLDEQNHHFVLWMGNRTSSVIEPMGDTSVPGELLWIGNKPYQANAYAVVKSEGKYYLYEVKYEYSYVTYSMEGSVTNYGELPAGAVNDQSCFAASQETPYLFVGTGSQLKAINLGNLNDLASAVIDVHTYDGDITDMHFDYDVNNLPTTEFSIAVSRAAGSSIMQIDPTIVEHGAILKRYDGIQGRIVSFCRKY